MVALRSMGVACGALLLAGCGKEAQPSGAGAAAGGGGDSAMMAAAGGNAGGAGGSGGGAAGGGAGQGGSQLVGIGEGELDATCMERTSNHVAGGRIVLRNAVTAEGDKSFIGFYDSEKQIECDVVQDAEGKYRCMPPAHDKDMNNRYFLDAECTDEVMYRGACAVDHRAEPVTEDACDDRRRIYAYGEALPDTMVYAGQPGGECKPYNVLNNLYRQGPEVVASEYAEVKPALWRGKGRIWARGYEGEGGLHWVQSLFDSQLEQRCAFEVMSDGLTHCAPNRQGNLTKYTDATCQEVLLDGQSLCGSPAPVYASYPSTDACKPGLSRVQAVAPYEGAPYSRGSCMPATNIAGPIFSAKATPDSDFLVLESNVASTDAGRLKPTYLTAADGGCFFNEWWDEELQTACSFASPYRGAPYYCVPVPDAASPAQAVETFSDAECTTPAPYIKMPSCGDAAPPKYHSVYEPACVIGWRTVRPVDPTPAVLPATLYVRPAATCEPYSPDATATYYSAGAEMPSTMFVEAMPEP